VNRKEPGHIFTQEQQPNKLLKLQLYVAHRNHVHLYPRTHHRAGRIHHRPACSHFTHRSSLLIHRSSCFIHLQRPVCHRNANRTPSRPRSRPRPRLHRRRLLGYRSAAGWLMADTYHRPRQFRHDSVGPVRVGHLGWVSAGLPRSAGLRL